MSGGLGEGDTPVLIPNTAVKPLSGDDSLHGENSTLPDFFLNPGTHFEYRDFFWLPERNRAIFAVSTAQLLTRGLCFAALALPPDPRGRCQAQPVGVLLDSAEESAIEGTIAGDDTVFVATKGRRQQEVLLRRLASWFGEEKHDR